MAEWRPVPGHPDYEVSDAGEVRSWKNNRWGRAAEPRLLKPSVRARGYTRVNVEGVPRFIHHLVLEAFVGPRPKGREAAHRNGKPADNRLSNLRWATPKENGEDNARNGVSKGELHGSSKLTEQDVREIRQSKASQRALAARYGVSPSRISVIRTRKAWAHVR